MPCCSHCHDAGEFFDLKNAQKELRRYRKKGPLKSTRLLIKGLKEHDLSATTLLDIGGGVGMIQYELFAEGLAAALQVDASRAYLQVAEQEAERRGFDDQTDYRYGDFVEIADEMQQMDIVTLDRVICCYPDMQKLVEASTRKAGHFYAVVFPKDNFFIKAGTKLVNLGFKLRRLDFRVYAHPVDKIESQIVGNGFAPVYKDSTVIWQVAVYQRV